MKKLLFVIPGMHAGGAERVLGMIADEFVRGGGSGTLMLTNQRPEDMVGYDLEKGLCVETLLDYEVSGGGTKWKTIRFISRSVGTVCDALHLKTPDKIAYWTFMHQYRAKVTAMRKYLLEHPDTDILAFLQPAVNICLLACEGLPNKLIISERADPERYGRSRYMPFFAKNYYKKAYKTVFQTEDAKKSFCDEVKEKSTVIFNPIKPGLPQAFDGERQKVIVNFCRISKQKNLPMLLEAFEIFHKAHTDYRLEIIGEGEKDVTENVRSIISEKGLSDSVSLLPFDPALHEKIRTYAMFVSSSDYEGMSNSMLEAMAIGLPAVCTDCPAGGARAIIKDGENGLLTPVGDAGALSFAMKAVAEDEALARKLSENGRKIRDELTLSAVAEKWIRLFD